MPPPPRKQKVGNFPGSSAEEIENEPDFGIGSHNHRIGFRNNQNRIAGITNEDDHWETSEERELARRAMNKYRKLREEHNEGKLLNFQDIMTAQTVCQTG